MALCGELEGEIVHHGNFQIAEYEDEHTDAFPADPTGARPDSAGKTRQPLQRQNQTAPDLLLRFQHTEVPSGEAVNQRTRLNSDPPPSEPQTPDELGSFRGRSQSAPPILWVAMRYGRELRRMSDEFHMTFQGLPRPKSAGYASELKKSSGWGGFFQRFFGPSRKKEGPPTPKEC